MKTIEEAKKCICPLMSRQFTTGHKENCIADECMYWRFAPDGVYQKNTGEITHGKGKGYCGQAGKPE